MPPRDPIPFRSAGWQAGETTSPFVHSPGRRWVRFDHVLKKATPDYLAGAAFEFQFVVGRWICSGIYISSDSELTSARRQDVPLGLLIDQARAAIKMINRRPRLPESRPR